MKEQRQHIRDNNIFKHSSSKKHLKIFVPDFAFKHDNDDAHGKDKFVGREIPFRRLYTWLTSDSKSGSYLITGYRGMGKSLLVRRVIEVISREPKAYKEIFYQMAMILFFVACYLFISYEKLVSLWVLGLFAVSFVMVSGLYFSNKFNFYLFGKERQKLSKYRMFDKEMVSKFFIKRKDRRERQYNVMPITINLGQEILDERDVLSLMAQNIYEKYQKFVKNQQSRPFYGMMKFGFCCVVSCVLTKNVFFHYGNELISVWLSEFDTSNAVVNHFIGDSTNVINDISESSFLGNLTTGLLLGIQHLAVNYGFIRFLLYAVSFWLTCKIFQAIRKRTPFFSVPFQSLERLSLLCERIKSTINEETGAHPRYNSSFFTVSILGEGKNKTTPMANVREIEQELLSIVNGINGEDCPSTYQAQFVIVFDELDKITKAANKKVISEEREKEGTPDFDTTVDGFTDAMAYEERKQNVLRLLANMKLFISSVKAKCIFISGHELFDASMADLSDREFAINSIFNGVLNVCSFLSPERGETDVSSMAELYLATMLIPEDYIVEKICENSGHNELLKDEQPSLRWYYEYLMETHVQVDNTSTETELCERKNEIMYAVEFLRYFTVFLSHISNGSPKKIATYFEKYIKTNYDAIKQFEWYDEIVVGVPSEQDVRKQCVLCFDPNSQKLINFVYYLASPVMHAITNEVSNYGDKLLVSSSFMLDQIYKYHGKGFSWRNLEQMPELLTSNKNPELRDSMSSIVEFLLQVHIANISFGIFQFKFHKQISEEISALSKISEEASAIFNFTLNESETVKRYNTRLLGHYLKLAGRKPDAYIYKDILERLHENQGDIFFFEEDYYRAIHEYRSSLQYIPRGEYSAAGVLSHLRCSLKIGMAYEYRKTPENAYMMYCEIINNLIHLHWVEEGNLGLDYTMRLSGDWRLKQTVLVDKATFKNKFDLNEDSSLRRQFRSGIWEDLKNEWGVLNPQYSLDAERTISGLAGLYTPEKSDLFERLTSFEDIKYVYQPIIAKLFVTEKMQLSGITQSSLEEAEAEFMTLFSDTNSVEKFMIAAGFFSKMAEILYYKNNFVISYHSENLASALYRFDINVFGLLDDYCFMKCGSEKEDAIAVKNDIRDFFYKTKLANVGKEVFDKDSVDFKTLFAFEMENNSGNCRVSDYLNYLSDKNIFNINSRWAKIKDCSGRITELDKAGYKLPCNACKYVNRSLVILMKNMFRGDLTQNIDFEKDSKAVSLLKFTSHKYIKHLRPSHISLLASTAEQIANILLSCSSTDVRQKKLVSNYDSEISIEVVELLELLSSEDINEGKRSESIEYFKNKIVSANSCESDTTHLQKLDKVLLYYWAAFRYYEIATMYKEAVQCVERIMKVLEDYLKVICFDQATEHRIRVIKRIKRNGNSVFPMIENLFKRAAVVAGRQYDNFDMAEIHEYKWLFHLEHSDDVDLAKLSIFPSLQTVFNSAIKCKLMCFQYLDKKNHSYPWNKEEYQDYLTKIYHRVAPSLRHEKTFKGEIEAYYMKSYLNRLVWVDILGVDALGKERENYLRDYSNSNKGQPEHHKMFYSTLIKYLKQNETKGLDKRIFGIDNTVQLKLKLLDFLVYDSMVCLSNILKVLTPHNHITTFSNSFVAEIYDMLWGWSKYYELLYDMYIYYRYDDEGNEEMKKKVVKMSSRNTDTEVKDVDKLLSDCIGYMKRNGVNSKDEFGYLYSKLFIDIRHDMDDTTIHHIYTNYSAEMAIKYYRIARDINSEGAAYKDMIGNMYVLNDDLHNDTCRFNLADERYILNSGLIYTKRRQLEKMYEISNVNKMTSYEKSLDGNESESIFKMIQDRFADSLYMNTEY